MLIRFFETWTMSCKTMSWEEQAVNPYVQKQGLEPTNCTWIKGFTFQASDPYNVVKDYIKKNPARNCCTVDSNRKVTHWKLPERTEVLFRQANGITFYYHYNHLASRKDVWKTWFFCWETLLNKTVVWSIKNIVSQNVDGITFKKKQCGRLLKFSFVKQCDKCVISRSPLYNVINCVWSL